MESNNANCTITSLCELAYKYGTDKCPQIKHAYTPYYYALFNQRRLSTKKVLEIGVGSTRKNKPKPKVVHELGVKTHLSRGASLYMWREFFPNAQIFGADIRTETIFEEERIKTYLCDERKKEDLVNLIKNTGSDIDLLIDDASHHVDDQIFSAQTLLPLLKRGVTYIIEDVTHSKLIRKALGDGYTYYLPQIPRKWHGGMLLVVTNKHYGIK